MRVITVITLLLVLNILSVSGEGPGAQLSTLGVVLRNLTERESYDLKDSVVLEFEVINLGSEPIGVFAKLGMGCQGGMILHVLDSSGAEIQRPTVDDDPLDVDAMRDARSYFRLRPRQFFGTRQKYAVSDLVRQPGHYKLLAEYHSPVSSEYAAVENFWSMKRKSVVSAEVVFNVK